ncbi:protein asteroid homolog 1-like isoform X2 [Thalassophryne amazonica]|uniref:protein asteroid homolog 1-like isoform X2 n=1 Tax=Thalassophryne amazonica TaxID=390379 RepID=UPI001471C407|nr:protein asteroid homolog 1-like isoform X2 [Thalassophryne amazonica]
MGVQGLSSFIKSHPQLYREIRFRQSRLVIDGCNLNYLLYFGSGLNQRHGGEYAAYEKLIEKFVTALRDCNISPFVVLDGGAGSTDNKLNTLIQRAEDKIQKAHRTALGGQEDVLPPLSMLLFRQTLVRLNVPVAMCYGEADQEIAALAFEWQCPVLSNDSDFYIFNLPAGLLPVSHFQWEAMNQSRTQKYIPCKSYKSSSFCIFFNIKPQVLPIFAVLTGNDYVKIESLLCQFAPAGSGKAAQIKGLIYWLRKFQQPKEAFMALEQLLGNLSSNDKAVILDSLMVGMEEYQLPSSCLRAFFTDGTVPALSAGEQVPDWIRIPLTKAELSGDVLDILLLHRISLGYPVDCADLPSAHLTSRPLRQLMYGLLLGPGQQVEEMDRDGLRVRKVRVHSAVTEDTKWLPLHSLQEVAHPLRLQVLLGALGVNKEYLSCLPLQWHLPLAVTCYWLKSAEPQPETRLLKALLMTMSNSYDPVYQQTWSTNCTWVLDVGVAHSLNQWQACLKNSIHLNQLLGFPLPEPHIARLYKGTLVHWMVHRMSPGKKLKPYLKYNLSSMKMYKVLLGVVNRFQNQKALISSKTKKTVKPPRVRPVDDLSTGLQRLFLHDKDDGETESGAGGVGSADEDLDHMVSVKTRYRAKDRKDRSNNPELVRKKECRGWNLV